MIEHMLVSGTWSKTAAFAKVLWSATIDENKGQWFVQQKRRLATDI